MALGLFPCPVNRDELLNLVRHLAEWGRTIEVRGKEYLEITGVMMDFPYCTNLVKLAEIFPDFSRHLCGVRTDYVLKTFFHHLKINVIDQLTNYPTSRRAVIYEPDWTWDGRPACIVACVFFIRDSFLQCHVYSRSEYLLHLPYDIHCCSTMMDTVCKEISGLKPGSITFLISNLHIKKADLKRLGF